jgi:hypothetical protein
MSDIYDEDIPAIGSISAELIREAVEKARDAFWASLGESFPEITTGDLSPEDTALLETATNAVAVAWLSGNLPGHIVVIDEDGTVYETDMHGQAWTMAEAERQQRFAAEDGATLQIEIRDAT